MSAGGDAPIIRAWVRGRWRLPDGRVVTRTVRRDVLGDPDDAERTLIVLQELREELEAAGAHFAEGHGALVEVLGAMVA